MCTQGISQRNPCIYGAVLTTVAFALAAVVALGIITILANQNMLTLPNFSIGTPYSLGLLIAGSAFIGGIITLAIQHRTRSKKIEENDQENPKGINPIPYSPLTPDGSKDTTGSLGSSASNTTFKINSGERKD